MNYLSLSLLITLIIVTSQTFQGLRDDGLCQGNRFLFLSTYVLGRQQDLTLTINDISKSSKIQEVFYRDELYRTYRIYNIRHNMTYLEGKQNAELMGKNVLRVSGGSVRINLEFDWQKVQLGTSLKGNGTSTVGTDTIAYEKTLQTNSSHQLQWHLSQSSLITITNGLALSTMQPYKAGDYEILSNMLNKLKTNDTTVKDNLLKVININFQSILAQKVRDDPTLKFDKSIEYNYNDYRGNLTLQYNQTLMNSTLAEDGLYLLFSQVIKGDVDFQCGPTVPQVPQDPVFGGLQQFLSNSLLKSTLRYALKHGFLDVVLTQQFWQSRAFQFYVGDVHEVMPTSTKNLSTMLKLNGGCRGMNDPVFSFAPKGTSSYQVKVNFACSLDFSLNSTRLVNIDIVVTYQVVPKLKSKVLDFVLNTITGKPSFRESGNFKIQYEQLAQFMVGQTMSLAKGGNVIGSDYKAVPRKFPGAQVRKNYLLMFDSSAKLSKKTKQSKIQSDQ